VILNLEESLTSFGLLGTHVYFDGQVFHSGWRFGPSML
jgi:hypothetical protein